MSWLGNWAYRKKIKIHPELLDSDLTSFPFTLRLATDAGLQDKDLTEVFTEFGCK